MSFFSIWLLGLGLIFAAMTLVWLLSVVLTNAGIVDVFWGIGFIILGSYYYLRTGGGAARHIIVFVLVVLWGLRLSGYVAWRNRGKGEDFRYKAFRRKYGEGRYWWVSFFQVFLLQGVLMWLVSAPLLGAQMGAPSDPLGILDAAGFALWLSGFIFEAGGDLQMIRFKSKPENKGRVLDRGFWRFTRHPNYFGDACVWWGFGVFSLAGGYGWPILGSVLMTFLLLRISGVTLLEKSLADTKAHYRDYMRRTSPFFPWIPKKDPPE